MRANADARVRGLMQVLSQDRSLMGMDMPWRPLSAKAAVKLSLNKMRHSSVAYLVLRTASTERGPLPSQRAFSVRRSASHRQLGRPISCQALSTSASSLGSL